MSTQFAISLAFILLIFNGLFVAAEFALISARRSNVEPLALAGSRRARITLRAMERVSLMMAAAQLGITVCSLGIGALGEPAVASVIEPVLHALGLPAALLHPLAFTLALLIVVYLHMVAGEMVPKNISLAGPENVALILGPPLAFLVTVLHPLIWVLNWVANLFLRLLRVDPKDEIASAFTSEEVARLIAESRSAGMLDPQDQELLTSALELSDKRALDVVIPRSQLVMVPAAASARVLQLATAETGYSRLLLQADDGAVMGYIHVKDTLLATDLDAELPATLMRPLPEIPGVTLLTDAIGVLRRSGSHLARVVDAGHAPLGVLFLEDALEQLIGEVRDPAHQDES